ncbi:MULTISPECIES: LpqB family beta-propeller domain-containing protein [Streptosporangium]|uniref:Spore germination protein GerM n=1 Tax=Streptosporangium brasiliense TaxID=47480 RepID=A0ABT9R1H2_9ACTN|nr:LpqB family beta-propeller domain-containing protein [Streptosporangium brasiliense]MDP9862746.1 spore germination protein GerM [Streptosporangium brasiliense]
MQARTGRRVGAAGLVMMLTCVSTACSVIPTGGRSVAVDNVRNGNPLGDPYARVIAMPPSADWSPEEVVTGFRSAMASVDDPGRDVARKYLTQDFAKEWNPQSGVTVYKQDDKQDEYEKPPPAQEGDKETRVTLKGTVTAMIDQDGRYWPRSRSLNEPFTLVKGPEGWRISAAPDGLLLSEADVDRAYLRVDLYFLDSSWNGLVVDQVRVPIDPTSNFAKSAVERLLKGPSSLLRKAVNSAFRPGTELIGVTTEDNRVVINLTKPVDSDRIGPMSAQLAGTLAELTKGGWGFEVKVDGRPYYSSDAPLTIDAQEHSDFDPWTVPRDVHPYYLAGGALRILGKDNVGQPVQGRAGEKNDTRTSPAISGHKQVAALSADGKKISVAPLVAGGEWQDWVTGDSLTPPSWDRYSTLWTVDRPDDHTSVVMRHDGRQHYRVAAPDLDTVYVKSLKVARDGVHVAVVIKNGLEEQVSIGTVVGREGSTRITDLQPVVNGGDSQTIDDIAWKDGKTLYVLTGKSDLLEASATAEPKTLASDSRIESITALDGSLLAGAEDDNGNRQVLYWNRNSAKWEPMVKDETGSIAFTEKDGPSSPAYPLG